MGAHVAEWLGLIFRWLHVITAMAWIGNSFYFNWMDRSFEDPEPPREGVKGHLWMVHGGGFYHVDKFMVQPPQMPKLLHWFMWESYMTWISGFLLITTVYYFAADLYMVDPSVSSISPVAAVHLGLLTLFGGWLVYHLLHKSPLGRQPWPFAIVFFGLICALCYGLCQVLNPRAAYLHVGALLATCMTFNVWRVIIPGQRRMFAQMAAGEEVDPTPGIRAKERSVHNNYLTLPVVFVMISNHFPSTYGHRYNWLVLIALIVTGVGIRFFFNMRHQGKLLWWIPPLALASFAGLTWFTAPASAPTPSGDVDAPPFHEVRVVIATRCATCHSAYPDALPVAPNNVMFDTPDQIKTLAERIYQRAVVAKTMPMANQTGMPDEERELLGQWYLAGAPLE